MSYKIAIYPGTFDPITNGHLDIIARASKLFETLVIGISTNNPKNPKFSASKRMQITQDVISVNNLKNVKVEVFDGLLVEFAKEQQSSIIIRGLRAVSDFEYEFQMACVNSVLDKNLETIFLPSSGDMHFISSRFVKSIAELGGDVSSFVPKEVLKYLN